MSKHNWEEIIAYYDAGNSLRKCEEKYGIRRTVIYEQIKYRTVIRSRRNAAAIADKKQKHYAFSPDEDALLRELYKTMGIRKCAEVLERAHSSISSRLDNLGVKKREIKPIIDKSPTTDDLLMEQRKTHTYKEMAALHGMCESAIRRRCLAVQHKQAKGMQNDASSGS